MQLNIGKCSSRRSCNELVINFAAFLGTYQHAHSWGSSRSVCYLVGSQRTGKNDGELCDYHTPQAITACNESNGLILKFMGREPRVISVLFCISFIVRCWACESAIVRDAGVRGQARLWTRFRLGALVGVGRYCVRWDCWKKVDDGCR